ncbi:MAG: response regulator transcription factor [Verrucomicrobia bacterium]|nr:response regulator transcription factor [Verrucomicrobiota bacterium]
MRILIADDHEVVREGARMLIEREPGWEVCGVAENGRDAVTLAAKLQPDVVVLDLSMPELNGLDAALQIKRQLAQTEVLIFTGQETDELVRKVFEAGAKSFILKSEASRHLVEAIRSLCQHKPFFTTTVSAVLFARFLERCHGGSSQSDSDEQTADRLSPREREIVQLLAEGRSNKDVANMLGISLRTAETHRATILRKLRLDSFAGLVRYAIRNKIIEA